MTYIITEPCIGTKDTACVDVCPVDCIHPKSDEDGFDEAEQLYIDPDEMHRLRGLCSRLSGGSHFRRRGPSGPVERVFGDQRQLVPEVSGSAC